MGRTLVQNGASLVPFRANRANQNNYEVHCLQSSLTIPATSYLGKYSAIAASACLVDLQLGQANLIPCFSSHTSQILMREGGHYSLFTIFMSKNVRYA